MGAVGQSLQCTVGGFRFYYPCGRQKLIHTSGQSGESLHISCSTTGDEIQSANHEAI